MADKNTLVGTKIKAVSAPEKEIGIDSHGDLAAQLLSSAESSTLDLSVLENFTNISQTRESVYQLIDTMSNDDAVSSVLETYAEDVCEPNDNGQIMWSESSDANTNAYVTFLLESMNVDKHLYGWVYSLCKYGDVYFRLYRESDYGDDVLFDKQDEPKRLHEDLVEQLEKLDEAAFSNVDSEGNPQPLKENVILKLHKEDDHYVNYIEAVKNPGEMFELTRFGKTMGYIKAPATIQNTYDYATSAVGFQEYTQYKMKKKDVSIYQATDFAHASIEDNSSRVPEEVDIYVSDNDYDSESNGVTYNVKRGQSLLYNSFKIWREWKLLENSILLNRITKSSIVRILEIEVGDMPKESIRNTLRNIKQMVEQKSAINTGSSMTEYTNPGPVENTIYIPVHGEIGKINTQELGAESPDPKSLADIEYFRDKFYASLRVPKQFFNFTGDDAGFSGGESLALISSRYGKAVKRIQNSIIQAITDVVNLMLLDRGMVNYINKFTLRMQTPLTKEVKERKDAQNTQIGIVRDLMQVLSENVDDQVLKLKMLKELVAPATNGSEIINLIQDQIDTLEEELEPEEEENMEDMDMGTEPEMDTNLPTPGEAMGPSEPAEEEKPGLTPIEDTEEPVEEEPGFGEAFEGNNNDEDYLPSFQEMGISGGVDSNNF